MPALLSRPAPVRSSRIRELLHLVERPDVLSLAGGLPALDDRDADRVRGVLDGVMAETGPLGPVALQYGATEGLERLRALLADRAGTGVTAADVLVTTGSQQALDLVARVLVAPGDTVVLERPSYLGALQAFEAARADIVTVGSDEDGMDVEQLGALLSGGLQPQVVYVVPNFHNPTGAVLSEPRRRALAGLAAAYGFLVVEDDPYGELRFAGEPLPSLARWSDRVLRVGSASKVLAPGLRVGWAIGPRDVVHALGAMKQVADLHTPTLTQLVVAALLQDETGTAARLDERRRDARERALALDRALEGRLGGRLDRMRPSGGMFLWARATDGTDTDALFDRALAQGVAFVPGSAFELAPDGPGHGLRLSFATLAPADLERAVDRLARAWDG